jgi:hypothetical protein
MPHLGYKHAVRVCDACAMAEDSRKARRRSKSDLDNKEFPSELQAPAVDASAPRVLRRKRIPQTPHRVHDRHAAVMELIKLRKLKLLRFRSWWISDVTAAYARRFLLRMTALEVCYFQGRL